MLKNIQNKINRKKLNIDPFPYLFIKDFFDKKFVEDLNKMLPSFENIKDKGVVYQSKSQTKKTILPNSKDYKTLAKNKNFQKINFFFKKLKPIILKKFKKEIKKHVNKSHQKSQLKYHSSFSIMRSGYKKSPHIDRRDHLIHMIFYPDSDSSKGGEIIMNKIKKPEKIYDIFPDKNTLKIKKKYKVTNNSCLIILNVPWAYHSVSNYYGKKDRKYFYMVYDFPIKKTGSKFENRKKGFNANNFWNQEVKVKSLRRKKTFLTE
jgi:hypothetical protein